MRHSFSIVNIYDDLGHSKFDLFFVYTASWHAKVYRLHIVCVCVCRSSARGGWQTRQRRSRRSRFAAWSQRFSNWCRGTARRWRSCRSAVTRTPNGSSMRSALSTMPMTGTPLFRALRYRCKRSTCIYVIDTTLSRFTLNDVHQRTQGLFICWI